MINDYDDTENFLLTENQKMEEMEKLFDDNYINEKILEENGISVQEFLDYARKSANQDVHNLLQKFKDKSSDKKNDDKQEKNESSGSISLASKSIKSLITNEEISLENISILEKIGAIYYHTGFSIGMDDPLISYCRTRGLNKFQNNLYNMSSKFIKEAKHKMGHNWVNVLCNSYVDIWNENMEKSISKEKDKAFGKLMDNYLELKSKEREREANTDKSTSVKVRKISKDELKELKKDLIDARKTAVLSKNGEHVIYKDGIVNKEESRHISK